MKAYKLAVAAGAALLMGSAAAAPFSYSVTDLGSGGLDRTYAFALNDRGQVVGEGYTGRTRNAFAYGDGAYAIISPFGGTRNRATDINQAGQIVGSASQAGSAAGIHAYIEENGVATDLGTLGGPSSAAVGINDRGHVVGFSFIADPLVSHAFLYADGTMRDLGTLGGEGSSAYAINGQDDIVGEAETAAGLYQAFLYSNGSMVNLGSLYGQYSSARAINDHGVVTGSMQMGDYSRAFRYADGAMTDLGSLDGRASYANSVNNRGLIVGDSTAHYGESTGFIWDAGAMYDLNSLLGANTGWMITNAQDINARGQILARGCNAQGACNTLLLDPVAVPEPSILAVFLFGMFAMISGLALRARRQA